MDTTLTPEIKAALEYNDLLKYWHVGGYPNIVCAEIRKDLIWGDQLCVVYLQKPYHTDTRVYPCPKEI